MNYLALAAAGATLALGAWISGGKPKQDWQYNLQSQTSGTRNPVIRSASSGAACQLVPGGAGYEAEAGCRDVAPGLAGRLLILDGGGGTVLVTDATGAVLIEFSEGEGGVRESLDPSEPLLILEPGA